MGSGAIIEAGCLRVLALQVGTPYFHDTVVRYAQPCDAAPGPNLLYLLKCSFECVVEVLSLKCRVVLSPIKKRLMLSGDVEDNPRPLTAEQQQELLDAFRVIPMIQLGQTKVLSELKEIKENQLVAEGKLAALTARIAGIEKELLSVKEMDGEIWRFKEQNEIVTAQLSSLMMRHDVLENRSRRNNLIFYGLPDTVNETWDESERSVILPCSGSLGIQVGPSSIERAHRIGRFSTAKDRPIVAQFCSFKDKQNILSNAHKLKGSRLSLSKDFSLRVRSERKKLLDFAKEHNEKFKLRFNRLIMGTKTFTYNATTDCVVENIQ